jgi:hypothetical protein
MTPEDLKRCGIKHAPGTGKYCVKRGSRWVAFSWDGTQYVIPTDGLRYQCQGVSQAADYARAFGSVTYPTAKAALA